MDISVSEARPVYGPETGLDVQDEMLGTNGSIYMRFPFTFDGDPSQLDELDLVTRYDDGFVAYLNGQRLAAANVPIESSWDSTASGSFGAVNGQIPVRYFDTSASLGALQQGDECARRTRMNVTRDDADFFFEPQLIGSDVIQRSEQFFVVPTPGADNELPASPDPHDRG